MAVNYTQDQVEYIVNQYRLEPTRETVEDLAEELNKSVKSIIGKLSREGVYRKTEYTTKAGEKPVTKLELVEELEEKLGVTLSGLEKAPKVALKNILKGIANENM
jgi:hypothetical protein